MLEQIPCVVDFDPYPNPRVYILNVKNFMF